MSSGNGSTNEIISEQDMKTILVCGLSGVGKSRFINTVTGSKLTVGHTTVSETDKITVKGIPPVKMGDHWVQLVDTPGFQDSRDDDEVPVFQNIADWLAEQYKKQLRVTGIIYLRSIQEPRVLRAEAGLVKMFKKICGEEAMDHIVLTTNRWYPPPEKEEEDREAELINNPTRFGSTGSKRVQVQRLNSKYQREDALRIIRVFENLAPVTLQIQSEMVDEDMTYDKTAAGREIQADLVNKIKDMERDLEKQRKDNDKLKQSGEATERSLDDVRKQLLTAQGQHASLKQSTQDKLNDAEKAHKLEQKKIQDLLHTAAIRSQKIQDRLTKAEKQNDALKQSLQERASKGHFWDSLGRVVGAVATLGISEIIRD